MTAPTTEATCPSTNRQGRVLRCQVTGEHPFRGAPTPAEPEGPPVHFGGGISWTDPATARITATLSWLTSDLHHYRKNYYEATGPDGHKFTNEAKSSLADQLCRRYGTVQLTVRDYRYGAPRETVTTYRRGVRGGIHSAKG